MFTGLCFRGPYDGKMFSHPTPYFRVAVLPTLPKVIDFTDEDVKEFKVETYEYEHMVLVIPDQGLLEVWCAPSTLAEDVIKVITGETK